MKDLRIGQDIRILQDYIIAITNMLLGINSILRSYAILFMIAAIMFLIVGVGVLLSNAFAAAIPYFLTATIHLVLMSMFYGVSYRIKIYLSQSLGTANVKP